MRCIIREPVIFETAGLSRVEIRFVGFLQWLRLKFIGANQGSCLLEHVTLKICTWIAASYKLLIY